MTESESDAVFVGVDVGTGSVRAALFDARGRLLVNRARDITTRSPRPDFYEQSSEEIWSAVCHVVRSVVENVAVDRVKGIGFDATCSLVVVGESGAAFSLEDEGNVEGEENIYDVVVWMDHRAVDEADQINRTGHSALRYVGGKVSPEMQMPKLLWMKKNFSSEKWNAISGFFDLPDFLTWKATGDHARSLCTLVCKWNYRSGVDEEDSWDATFLQAIGLDDLLADSASKIGKTAREPGRPCAGGLSAGAAEVLGLSAGTAVGTALIDAHAGGLGLLGCKALESYDMTQRLALITGTSSCQMATSRRRLFVDGVWGPYHSAMIPGFWLNEGGQSAAGKLLDHILQSHAAAERLKTLAQREKRHPHDVLNDVLRRSADDKGLAEVDFLTQDLHIWPDFHGNRSPLADPTLKGMMMGLTLAGDLEDLALQYLAAIQAIAYGVKHIVDTLESSGHEFKVVPICGGLSHNAVFVRTHADVLGLAVVLPETSETVLLGAAILAKAAAAQTEVAAADHSRSKAATAPAATSAAAASGTVASTKNGAHVANGAAVADSAVLVAMRTMGGGGREIAPRDQVASYHAAKYKVFLKMLETQRECAADMRNWQKGFFPCP